MSKIEERAEAIAKRNEVVYSSDYNEYGQPIPMETSYNECYNSAVEGAREQAQIDTDAVCDMAEIVYDMFDLQKREIDRAKFIDAFRKAIKDNE